MAEFVQVAKLSDLGAGSCKAVQAAGKAIALFNVGGTIYALDNVCLHRGGPLGEGFLEGNIVTCPWHMWEYDVCTGERLGDPDLKVCTYPVQIEGDQIKVAI
jgi:nitrite reductase (NADH) small subunit